MNLCALYYHNIMAISNITFTYKVKKCIIKIILSGKEVVCHMDKINDIFDKLIYDSPEYNAVQERIDAELQNIIKKVPDVDSEQLGDQLNGVILSAEKDMFSLGMKYGLSLLRELNIRPDDSKLV